MCLFNKSNNIANVNIIKLVFHRRDWEISLTNIIKIRTSKQNVFESKRAPACVTLNLDWSSPDDNDDDDDDDIDDNNNKTSICKVP